VRRPAVDIARLFVVPHVAEQADEVGEHDTVRQLGASVDAGDIPPALSNGREGYNEVQV